ncbi:hypothetical protein CDL15_Pgr018642 [Punica granatum]|uniref:Uncharacterized protein n=1 Tax=Punica granatum TaxID=22663 RepID=A0A218WZI1_PUNGR|nr:hypothetical protein CDL15_Pgr018642 [Punica granatum]
MQRKPRPPLSFGAQGLSRDLRCIFGLPSEEKPHQKLENIESRREQVAFGSKKVHIVYVGMDEATDLMNMPLAA